MIFQDVNLSGLGPFAPARSLRFSAGCTLIEGGAGSGKTTIAQELMRIFRATYTPGPVPLEEALTLCFIGADYTNQRRRTASILAELLRGASAARASEVLGGVSANVNRLMKSKLASGTSKFGHPSQQRLPLVASLSADERVEIHDAHGADLRDLFVAAGENLVITVAVNLAVRKVLGFREPIVVDGALTHLDRYLLTSRFQAIVGRPEQRVILDVEDAFRLVSARPDVNVVVNEGRRSEVKAASGWALDPPGMQDALISGRTPSTGDRAQ